MLLELAQELGLEPKRVAGCGGGEYHSACPSCGGNDRFVIQPNYEMKNCVGRYICRQCGVKGDAIQFCRDFMGLDWEQALARCNARVPYQLRSLHFEKPKACQLRVPPILWQEKARSFVDWAHSKLKEKQSMLDWLAARGLPEEAIERYQIGYNENSRSGNGGFWLPRTDWGLPEEFKIDGKPKIVWLPKGLVIPTIEPSGAVVRLKIRRTDWTSVDKFPKYVAITGSMSGTNLVGDRRKEVMIVVESELDAYALQNQVHDIAFVVAVGSNTRNPDAFTDYLAKLKSNLLICHDNDAGGEAMLKKWQKLYPHAKAYPVNKGKDIGDFTQQGGNLREWLMLAI